MAPSDVKSFPDATLYDPQVVRTLFLNFDAADWEKELSDFNNTDVEVPARLTVDGKTYSDVGVPFRGASSYFTVGEGHKRSLNLSLDFANMGQNLYGYRTLNLLNSHTDSRFLRTILYVQIAGEYIAEPKANYVRLSMDMNATQPVYLRGQTPVTRANVRSELTLDGRPVASIAVGGGTMGEEGVDVSLTRPFDIPAEFTVSLRAADERVQDGRLRVKLVRTTW